MGLPLLVEALGVYLVSGVVVWAVQILGRWGWRCLIPRKND